MPAYGRGAAALERPADEVREQAEAGRGWYAALARTGLVAKGLSFGLVGVLAVKLAIGDGGQATSTQGALGQLSRGSFGKVALIALAIGFAAYALWRFVQAFAESASSEDGAAKAWAKRAADLGRGLVYTGVTYSTVRVVSGSGGGQSQNAKAHHSTAVVLGWPGGRAIVAAAGAGIVAVGCWTLYLGLTRRFEDRWRVGRISPALRTWGGRAGVLGHVARFVVFSLIGSFLVKAAIDYRPSDAIGLDGALQKLAQASYGPWLLGVTAAGLIAFGAYCLVDAGLRDVSAD